MSATSARRQRDLNAGTQKPARSVTPTSNSTLVKSSSGKESVRSAVSSRATLSAQKPMIRPVPRVEKAAVVAGSGGGNARLRWSSSSAPRGRSPSPSEFIRVSSDKENKGIRDLKLKRSEIGGKGYRFGENLVSKVKESERKSGDLKYLSGKISDAVNLSSNSVNSSEINDNYSSFKACNIKNSADFGSKVETRVNIEEKSGFRFGSASKTDKRAVHVVKEKSLNEGNASNASKEDSCRVEVKYSSKLHEKLAFLEGKVKRIASDIKRTKEMLDLNNPDESKVVLTDIQEKISGIEKAMNHVVGSDGKAAVLKSLENDKGNENIADNTNQVEIVSVLAKGLNSEQLEERLFPHHKLLRNRASLKISSGSAPNQEPSNKEDEKSLASIEDNPIAAEFLASLDRKGPGGLEQCEVQEVDSAHDSKVEDSSDMFHVKSVADFSLTTDEILDDFDDEEENKENNLMDELAEDDDSYQLNKIGSKVTTAGWFVSDGEAILAHDDGSCTFYDITNFEDKAVYKPPIGVSPSIWRDCWIIRAPSADGCSGRYVIAASAGNSLESGFCSWDFYTKEARAFHIEGAGTTASRTVLGPLPNKPVSRRNVLGNTLVPQNQQWWYKPCGPLISAVASSQKVVKVYDIRDGEQIMSWEVQKPVVAMDYSSPLQWRNRGKIVVAEAEKISLWDVNTTQAQALQSVPCSGQKITALHINNTDAELGGGVRQRASSSEAEGNDGVFCTLDSINILDFRNPSGIGIKIPKIGVNAQSVFSRGDSVFLGCTRSAGVKQTCFEVQQFSLHKGRLLSTYPMPESNTDSHQTTITQVWGNSSLVMGVSEQGLSVFSAFKDDPLALGNGSGGVTETIGLDDLYSPTFDYLSSRVLLISRDRPAMWKQVVC